MHASKELNPSVHKTKTPVVCERVCRAAQFCESQMEEQIQPHELAERLPRSMIAMMFLPLAMAICHSMSGPRKVAHVACLGSRTRVKRTSSSRRTVPATGGISCDEKDKFCVCRCCPTSPTEVAEDELRRAPQRLFDTSRFPSHCLHLAKDCRASLTRTPTGSACLTLTNLQQRAMRWNPLFDFLTAACEERAPDTALRRALH